MENSSGSEGSEEEEQEETKKQARSRKRREMREALNGNENVSAADGGEGEKKVRKKKRTELGEDFLKVAGKRGVCYLSRIPPHMKPLKLRHLLSQFGEVLRIYLAPEGI